MFVYTSLGIRVVFLARDPRGVMASRWDTDWCNTTDCSSPEVLCADMVDDFGAAAAISREFPGRIRLELQGFNKLNITNVTRLK